MIIKKFSYLKTENPKTVGSILPTSSSEVTKFEYDSLFGWLSGAYISGSTVASSKANVNSILNGDEDVILYWEEPKNRETIPVYNVPEQTIPVTNASDTEPTKLTDLNMCVKVISSSTIISATTGQYEGFDAAKNLLLSSLVISKDVNEVNSELVGIKTKTPSIPNADDIVPNTYTASQKISYIRDNIIQNNVGSHKQLNATGSYIFKLNVRDFGAENNSSKIIFKSRLSNGTYHNTIPPIMGTASTQMNNFDISSYWI